jgi:hypothetical protein
MIDSLGLPRKHGYFIDVDSFHGTTSLMGAARPSGVHQNAPHHLRRDREELRPVLLLDVLDVHQAEIHFIDQSSGLKGVARCARRSKAARSPPLQAFSKPR